MDTLWDNIGKIYYEKGYAEGLKLGMEKAAVKKGEQIIRDQIGDALKLVKEGKITNQELIDRMRALVEDKSGTVSDKEHA